MDVVVVESPAKAATINKYLGPNYKVLASYGHVRDLPSRNGSVRPDEDFAMSWEIDERAKKRLDEIARALRGAGRLILATDPDREGEAISWHVYQVLREKHALKDVAVERVVFNEITKSAVLEAMKHPRKVDDWLVDAYRARRALDYLVGFTLSPVLWRKLPGARSAGRVQSVALRLVCEREIEIERFVPREYWHVDTLFETPAAARFTARLSELDGQKLDRLAIGDQGAAEAAKARILAESFAVAEVEKKPARRNPPPPFITSTLQQEAARKLGFSAARTMQIAQRLYEGIDIGGEHVGLITYMRTDGVQIAEEALAACREVIRQDFGPDYLPEQARRYKSKAKNAQEAHEAIRPTDPRRAPAQVAALLERDHLRLYELIWKRTLASQMESARLERTVVDIRSPDRRVALRATGSVLQFPGFLALYQEGRDDLPESAPAAGPEDDEERRLPPMEAGDRLRTIEVTPSQHFTEPPPRYSEASLVKKLEELGIGRPSTYATILSVLRERNYVRMEKGRFIAEDKGLIVTAFLESFFRRYVEYDFTANLEQLLDEISAGQIDWKEVLRDFWRDFSAAVQDISGLRVAEVLESLNEILGPHIFPQTEPGLDPRACPNCGEGRLSLKLGRFGAFIGCSNYPDCRYTRPLVPADDGAQPIADDGTKILGTDPESGLEVSLRSGRFGPYVQLGEGGDGTKPKRASIPRDLKPDEISLGTALTLLAMPRELGLHPETGAPILVGIGRYGPYLKYQGRYVRLASSEEALSIGLNRAVALLAEAGTRETRGGRAAKQPLRDLGPHPQDGAPVMIFEGRYGPYVSHGGINATLPAGQSPEGVSLDEAVALLDARQAKSGKASRPKRSAAKAAPAKAAPAKTASAKTAGKAAGGQASAGKRAAKRSGAGAGRTTSGKARTGAGARS